LVGLGHSYILMVPYWTEQQQWFWRGTLSWF
jgi:hypothetical protein